MVLNPTDQFDPVIVNLTARYKTAMQLLQAVFQVQIFGIFQHKLTKLLAVCRDLGKERIDVCQNGLHLSG